MRLILPLEIIMMILLDWGYINLNDKDYVKNNN